MAPPRDSGGQRASSQYPDWPFLANTPSPRHRAGRDVPARSRQPNAGHGDGGTSPEGCLRPQCLAARQAGEPAHALTANEIDQIGLRLAKDLGHTAIYAADADGDFPFQRVTNFAKATGQSAKLEAIMAEIGEMVKAQGEYLRTHTVLQTLLYLSSEARVAQDVGYYYLLARYGEAGDYAGPDLLAEWYRRNVRIYNNVTKLVAAPEDRVLVIFGAGHLGWLRQDFGADPTLRLRKLEEFVAAGTGAAERH